MIRTPEMASAVSCRSLLFNMIMVIIAMLPISATAQTYRSATLGSSILANNANSTWISPSGEFVFGFQRVAPGGYLLAIWFDKIPEKTIVWSANRDNLAEEGSAIQLLADGRFELSDPSGRQIWAANLAASGVAYGAMLDTGNFVLASNTSAILWQSFEEPTDTLLPTQILKRGVNLISGFSETNHTRGRFKLAMQNDGNLVLSTINFPMTDSIYGYWSTHTQQGLQLIFNRSGYIYLTSGNRTILSSLSTGGTPASQFYQRLTLAYDGVLRHYVYPKSANSAGERAMAWSVNTFYPANICAEMGKENTKGGACGFNSFCSLGPDDRPKCSCTFGYSPIDPNDSLSGCKQDFVPQTCGQESQEKDLFSLITLPNTDWAMSDYAIFRSVDEDWCRQACLGDCFCAAAAYSQRGCYKKSIPLNNGRLGYSEGIKLLVKVRKNDTAVSPSGCYSSSKSDQSTLIITGSVLLGSSVFLNILLLASILLFVFHFNRRKSSKTQAFPGVSIRSFSFDELQEATSGFKDELGQGACSTVFRGALKDENGKLVAVKKLDKIPKEADQEFKAEVSSISRTNHKNLVQLLGYCDEGQNRILVYEFMSNGSLANFLFQSSSKPNWHRRIQIAFATARGLCYLHEECRTQIIHCDIKPQNVLLDDSHTPKISDFGLAKLLKPDQTKTTTGIRGTRGYVAPEWFRNMPITAKVDVYSYGILLLESLCCRRHYEPDDVDDEREVILADWAYDCYKAGTLDLLVAGDEEAKNNIELFEKFVMIAIWCIQEDPAMRPQMKRVMHMFEGSAEVPAPPDPTCIHYA